MLYIYVVCRPCCNGVRDGEHAGAGDPHPGGQQRDLGHQEPGHGQEVTHQTETQTRQEPGHGQEVTPDRDTDTPGARTWPGGKTRQRRQEQEEQTETDRAGR